VLSAIKEYIKFNSQGIYFSIQICSLFLFYQLFILGDFGYEK